jgi:hypothetical protein
VAGTYPDVPGRRMAYDRDGTVGFTIDAANNVVQLDDASMRAGNDESNSIMARVDEGFHPGLWVGVLFPELRDLSGFYLGYSGYGPAGPLLHLQYSTNSTSGLDGTWATWGADPPPQTPNVSPDYRVSVNAASLSGVRGVRVYIPPTFSSGINNLLAIHLYGQPATGQAPNRLRIWHPTLDQEVTGPYFDWGDVARGTSASRDFRVKNFSGTQTAHSVEVLLETLTDAVPSVVSQHTLTYHGSSPAVSVNIGDLGPNAASDVLTVARFTPTNAQLSAWALRIIAAAGSWGA